MSRHQKFIFLLNNFHLSKGLVFNTNDFLTFKAITVSAGHFKPSTLYIEHFFIFLFLTSYIPRIFLKKHGKRKKPTFFFEKTLNTKFKLLFIDKFINVLITSMHNLDSTFKLSRQSFKNYKVTWSIKENFEPSALDPFLTDRIISREVFMPITITFILKTKTKSKLSGLYIKNYIRMFRVPLTNK